MGTITTVVLEIQFDFSEGSHAYPWWASCYRRVGDSWCSVFFL